MHRVLRHVERWQVGDVSDPVRVLVQFFSAVAGAAISYWLTFRHAGARRLSTSGRTKRVRCRPSNDVRSRAWPGLGFLVGVDIGRPHAVPAAPGSHDNAPAREAAGPGAALVSVGDGAAASTGEDGCLGVGPGKSPLYLHDAELGPSDWEAGCACRPSRREPGPLARSWSPSDYADLRRCTSPSRTGDPRQRSA